MPKFKLKSNFRPMGDQSQAITKLVHGLNQQKKHQTLLGVTGSGKTFTMANVIQQAQKPTLIISHNKTLAAQLYQEFRDFFPDNAVSYFVSYYDYYQPEAYIPSSDTYIEKETNINDEIDKLRLSATTHLLTRSDVIVIASVSCIYNLGSPLEYGRYILELIQGQLIHKTDILSRLTDLQYENTQYQLKRGSFQLKGDLILIWPAYTDYALKLEMLDNQIESLSRVNPLTLDTLECNHQRLPKEVIYPAKHYQVNPETQQQAIDQIKTDLQTRVNYFKQKNQIVESYRIQQKVKNDIDMIQKLGFVNGIENYSRYFDGRKPGQPPYTLLDYFKLNSKTYKTNGYLTIIDESHITLPQIKSMYRGDQSRKQTLIDYGFRLPSALDNRPLTSLEFFHRQDHLIYTSATPNQKEINLSSGIIEQLIRPTGLLDPQIIIKKSHNQIKDLTQEILKRKQKKQRTLVTTLTKKMAESLSEYLIENAKTTGLKVTYLHSGIDTLDRSDILADLRKGVYDVLIGINLLREGLDLPEVSLVAILDADKQGFLRSTTSLIQTMGRAARHQDGQVIMYADKTSPAMAQAIKEIKRRKQIQINYNLKNKITPISINKPIRKELLVRQIKTKPANNLIFLNNTLTLDINNFKTDSLTPSDKTKLKKELNKKMRQAAKVMDFEQAITIRDLLENLT